MRVVPALLLAACAERDTDPHTDVLDESELPVGDVPDRLAGSGAATDDEGPDTATCAWSFLADELVVGDDGWSGTLIAGEVVRASSDGTLGGEFQASIGGTVSLVSSGPGTAELRFTGEQPADAVPFWRALEVVTGTEDGPWVWSGTWTCAETGLVTGEHTDDGPVVTGTWTLGPER